MTNDYKRLEIDPEKWPKKYWNNSFHCNECDVNWPLEQHFIICPQCHSANVHNLKIPPDMRWPEAVKILLEERFESFYQEWIQERATETDEAFAKIIEAA